MKRREKRVCPADDSEAACRRISKKPFQPLTHRLPTLQINRSLAEPLAAFKRTRDLQLCLFLHHRAQEYKSLLAQNIVDTFVGRQRTNEALQDAAADSAFGDIFSPPPEENNTLLMAHPSQVGK